MAHISQRGGSASPQTSGAGYLFGVPLGDLGWFTSLVMSFAVGFAAFFAATFCAIVTMLVYSAVTHRYVDFANTYKWFGLPVGIVVLFTALIYLGSLWLRRHAGKA